MDPTRTLQHPMDIQPQDLTVLQRLLHTMEPSAIGHHLMATHQDLYHMHPPGPSTQHQWPQVMGHTPIAMPILRNLMAVIMALHLV